MVSFLASLEPCHRKPVQAKIMGLCIIFVMRRLLKKILSLSTALLVALMPLQVAADSFADASGTEDKRVQESIVIPGVEAHTAELAASQSCEQCEVEESCLIINCPTGHCTSCATLLSSHARDFSFPVSDQNTRRLNEGPARLLFDSLFRPPKV